MIEGRKNVMTRGRNIGALVGGIVFLVFGVVPGFYVGSYGGVLILSKLAATPAYSGVIVRVFLVSGIILSLFCIAALSIIIGAIIGTFFAYLSDFFKELSAPAEEERGAGDVRHTVKRHPLLSPEAKTQVLSQLSFLNDYLQEIHSIVLIGSAAYGHQDEDSDIDLVVVCTEKGYDPFRKYLCAWELDMCEKDTQGPKFDFTVLSTDQTESFFQASSPFAWAIRYGAILRDDGYLERLLSQRHPALTARKHFVSVLYENIAVQFYGIINAMEREIRKNKCSDDCCRTREGCAGLSTSRTLPKLVMSMLYVTLPSRGYMPLTKRDVVEYAEALYGSGTREILGKTIHGLRNVSIPIYFTDYRRIKPFAIRLFTEILRIVGIRKDVVRILRNAANLIRGDYEKIDDEALRKCVL